MNVKIEITKDELLQIVRDNLSAHLVLPANLLINDVLPEFDGDSFKGITLQTKQLEHR